jgi:hypothetical protein
LPIFVETAFGTGASAVAVVPVDVEVPALSLVDVALVEVCSADLPCAVEPVADGLWEALCPEDWDFVAPDPLVAGFCALPFGALAAPAFGAVVPVWAFAAPVVPAFGP